MKRRSSFTLIELLIVIAVISILIGIALPRFRGMQDEGNIARVKGELRTLQTAIESFYIHNSNAYPSTYPDDLEGATPRIIDTTAPTDPFNPGTDYVYAQSDNDAYYVLYSVGPAGNGRAVVSDAGVITETNGATCIYVSNADIDTQP